MRVVVVALLAANATDVVVTTIRWVVRKPYSTQTVLNGDVFSFNSAKLAHLLPEYPDEIGHTGSSAIIQETAKLLPSAAPGQHSKSKQHP